MSENGSALGGFRFFLVYFGEHPFRPSGRQRNFLKLVCDKTSQNFLADIFLRTFFIPLFGATIIIVSFLRFGSYGATALPANEHISKWVFFLARFFRTRTICHDFLTRFKKFLWNHRLMLSVIHFPVVFENTIIKRIGKYALDIGNGKHVFLSTQQAGGS
ncbi:MAG: hypothetical protein PHW31_00070 [Candidatus Pacebacteria bacterium]|nr:hypothetical protein [Candidatus Paceibacterota bacterium]